MMIFRIQASKDKQGVIDYIEKLPDKVYRVEITLKRENRTVSQNRLYWLYLACLEDETGMEKECLHDYFKQKYLTIEDVEIGNITIKKTISTTKLNTSQFSEYTNKIAAFASAELGIILPNPEDLAFEQFCEYYKNRI